MSKAKINEKRIDQIERKVKHDVIAFLTSISEYTGPPARFLHQGLTSSDILDTAFNVQLMRSAENLKRDQCTPKISKNFFKTQKNNLYRKKHGIHAEPTTFGIKMAGFTQNLQEI